MTGRSRSCRSPASCSSTWKPSISGISMSSSSRSKPSRRSISSATRPFSADATLCPCNSRLRVSSSRLTLLSSTTSRRPGAASQLTHDATPSGPRQRANIRQPARPAARRRARCTVAAPSSSSSRAIAPRVSAPKVLLLDLSECAVRRNLSASFAASARRRSSSMTGASCRKVSTSSSDELGAGRFLQRFEGRAIDRRCAHQRSLRADAWFNASTRRSTRIGLVR